MASMYSEASGDLGFRVVWEFRVPRVLSFVATYLDASPEATTLNHKIGILPASCLDLVCGLGL